VEIQGHVLGLDVGGTKIAAVVADASSDIVAKVRRPTPAALGPDGIVPAMVEMLDEAAGAAGIRVQDANALGVSFGGPYDVVGGVVRDIPNLPDWGGTPLYQLLSDALPGLAVGIDNDANAAALAEWRFGAGKGSNHMLFLTMGTGIGGGIVSDGRLYRGHKNTGGEVGHTVLVPDGPACGCGRRGCVEAYASGPAIARRAREKLRAGEGREFLTRLTDRGVGADDLRTEQVVEAARDGDAFALAHLDDTAYYMGWGIANAISVLAPEVVVIGTVATAAGDLFLGPLRRHTDAMTMPGLRGTTRIEPAGLGDLVGDYAAVALAVEAFETTGDRP
jgi:glucokinase